LRCRSTTAPSSARGLPPIASCSFTEVFNIPEE
jgi:hypothetical protein